MTAKSKGSCTLHPPLRGERGHADTVTRDSADNTVTVAGSGPGSAGSGLRVRHRHRGDRRRHDHLRLRRQRGHRPLRRRRAAHLRRHRRRAYYNTIDGNPECKSAARQHGDLHVPRAAPSPRWGSSTTAGTRLRHLQQREGRRRHAQHLTEAALHRPVPLSRGGRLGSGHVHGELGRRRPPRPLRRLAGPA